MSFGVRRLVMGSPLDVRSRAELAAIVEQLAVQVRQGLPASELLSRLAAGLRHIPWVNSLATKLASEQHGWAVVADTLRRAASGQVAGAGPDAADVM
jgi:hypothetical protein